jgi:biotin carboxyl carrier protein
VTANRREVVAIAAAGEGARVELRSPIVGLLRGASRVGAHVDGAATVLGEIEVLGTLVTVRAPDGVRGVVVGPAHPAARTPVEHGTVLAVLDTSAATVAGTATAGAPATAAAHATAAATVFRSPMSGRYYASPGPGKPPFVSNGDVIEAGRTVALFEVMKTFNRVAFGGAGLPPRARVVRIVPNNEDDVAAGDVLLEIEPAP